MMGNFTWSVVIAIPLCFLSNACSSRAAESSVILSESFETIPRGGYSTGNLISGWLVSGSVEVHSDPYGITGPSHTGAKALEVNGGSAGSISTNLHTAPGHVYVLSFAFTKNPFISSARAAIEIDGGVVTNITADQTNSHDAMNWRSGQVAFAAAYTNTLLALRGLESGNAGVYFDTLELRTLGNSFVARVNGNLVTNAQAYARGKAQIGLFSPFPGGVTLYTLDGSDPSNNGLLYTGEFVVHSSVPLRAVAYNANFAESQQLGPIDVFVLPQLFARTDGGGTVNIDPPDGGYGPGSTAVLTATPTPGWSFVHWMGDVYSTNADLTVTVTNNLCVSAVFGTPVTNSIIGSGMVHLNPAATMYPYGTRVQLTATPQPGAHFVQWGGEASGTNNPLRLTVTNSNLRVTALFAALPGGSHTLTVTPQGGGSAQLAPSGNRFPTGTTVLVTAVAEPDQQFIGWSGDATGTNNPVAVSMTRSKVITAIFSSKPRIALRPCGADRLDTPFRMTVLGPLGRTIHVQDSPDLLEWDSLLTFTNNAGATELIDRSAARPKRFYRAQLLDD